MRLSSFLPIAGLSIAALLAGCGSPAPEQKAPPDPTAAAWYRETLDDLVTKIGDAKDFIKRGKNDEAAVLIQAGETLSSRLLAVPRPTLAATEAASDLDEMYGQMLFSNHNYGWARLFFQKNAARWKNWRPRTPDTAQRLKQAESEIGECDTHIAG